MPKLFNRRNNKKNRDERIVILDNTTTINDLKSLDQNINTAWCMPNSRLTATVLKALPSHIKHLENYTGPSDALPADFTRLSIVNNVATYSRSQLLTGIYWYKKTMMGERAAPSNHAEPPIITSKQAAATNANQTPYRNPAVKRSLDFDTCEQNHLPKKSRI
jgi:hypothetical protein